ncbi:MAG: hypothetical protein WC765_00765 [Phycisphaerae bacterium]|jgi:hypothetical protein
MGRVAKFRDCPAVGRPIKPIECGQNRGKNYACPADCPHCPWMVANYDDFLKIEGSPSSNDNVTSAIAWRLAVLSP